MALFPVFAGRLRIPVFASPLFIVADPKQVIAQYSAEPAAPSSLQSNVSAVGQSTITNKLQDNLNSRDDTTAKQAIRLPNEYNDDEG